MAQNKKHHFVPRFYLKRFSNDGKSINLYNLKSSRAILRANLRNQCYRDYFYGRELNVEYALASVEEEAANLFRQIDYYGCLPPPHLPAHIELLLHVLIQHARTVDSAETLDEMTDQMMKHILKSKAEADGIDLSEFRIGIKDPARYSLGVATQCYPLLLDMGYKLLVNRTREEFVASDNPVVFYNQYFHFRPFGSNAGVASKGLQIFVPLDPEKMVLLYDSDVYSVGTTNKKAVVEITTPTDIYGLNTLQMCSADENIYFRNKDINLGALHRKARPFLRKRKVNCDVFAKEETGEERRELVVTSREDIRTNLAFTFLRIRRSAKRWRDSFRKMKSQPAVVVRNQQMCDDHEEFRNLVKNGQYKPGDCFVFLEKKYGPGVSWLHDTR